MCKRCERVWVSRWKARVPVARAYWQAAASVTRDLALHDPGQPGLSAAAGTESGAGIRRTSGWHSEQARLSGPGRPGQPGGSAAARPGPFAGPLAVGAAAATRKAKGERPAGCADTETSSCSLVVPAAHLLTRPLQLDDSVYTELNPQFCANSVRIHGPESWV